MTAARLRWAAATLAFVVLTSAASLTSAAGLTSAANGQTDAPSGTLTLASQTSWVDPVQSNEFRLRVGVATSLPAADTRLIINVYTRLTTRSDFRRTLSNTFSGSVIAQPIASTLDSLHPDANGVVEIDIPIAAGPRQGSNLLYLAASGVYPLSVEVRPRTGGPAYARLVTTILYNAAPITGPRLRVAWVAPIHGALADPRSDSSVAAVDRATRDGLGALAQYLDVHPALPAALAVTPDTLARLAVTDPGLVARLGRAVGAREVLATTWVPVSLAAMLQAGLTDDFSRSLTRSTDTLTRDLGVNVAGRTWVENGPITADALTMLRGAQFDRVVLPESDLSASPSRLTVSQPFEVQGSGRTPIRAAVADTGLQEHFSNGGDQVLAAHQLLADLDEIYNDAPANLRGVVALAPSSWIPTVPFMDAWLAGLDGSPVLQATQLDDFFDAVPPTIGHANQPLTRELVVDESAIRAAAGDLLADQQRAAQAKLRSLDDSLSPDSPGFARLERLELEVPSEEMSVSERRDRVDTLNTMIGAEMNAVSLGGPRTITLTARTGRLPLNLVSQFDAPVKVQLEIQSDKLQFPGFSSTGNASFQIELHKGNNPFDVTVRARTSGAFPLTLTVLTHDGQFVMTQTKFTIQSTALSGVGVVLSVGAALFLVVWWARHTWRNRRRGAHAKAARRRSSAVLGDETPVRTGR